GRKHEADYVCFNGPVRDRNSSLLVVEAKTPGEDLPDGKKQAESYAANLRAPIFLLTNGVRLQVWQFQWSQESTTIIDIPLAELSANRGKIEQSISKQALVDYCERLKIKTILLASATYDRYETAELARTEK